MVPSEDVAVWRALVDSLVRTAESMPGRFVIVTESFGSILAEILYTRLSAKDRARVAGILHSPPVLDLGRSFRRILEIGAAEFEKAGDRERSARMNQLLAEVGARPQLDADALLRGIVLAFESPSLMPLYFRSIEILGKWAGGFAAPGFAPEAEMRDRILRGMVADGAPSRTTFAPDVPTWVVGGGTDPYHSLADFEAAIEVANRSPRRTPIEWRPFAEAAHYPHVDAFDRWRDEVWVPFRKLALKT